MMESSVAVRCPHRSEIQSIALAGTEGEKFFPVYTLDIYWFNLLFLGHSSPHSVLVIAETLCANDNLHVKQSFYTFVEFLTQ